MAKFISTTLAFALLGLSQAVSAQDNAGVNAIYERMSAAYDNLDSKAFADIYMEDGVYLRSNESPMRVGVEAIIENYESFFSSVREEGGRRQLLFRIVNRQCSDTLCSDVGWYKLNAYDSEGNLQGTSYGRFLTTPGKGEDGMWRFIADVDTGATEEFWNTAQRIPGVHFDD